LIKRRRVGSTGSADVFVGGVLCTLSAWVIRFILRMARVRAGAEVRSFPSACFYGSIVIMKKSIKVAPKRRGRPPAGGRDPGVHIRLPESMLAEIDARSVEDGTSRSEAIRRLVEIGLSVKAKGK
jgi:ribbon-helix-helix CopG family protein